MAFPKTGRLARPIPHSRLFLLGCGLSRAVAQRMVGAEFDDETPSRWAKLARLAVPRQLRSDSKREGAARYSSDTSSPTRSRIGSRTKVRWVAVANVIAKDSGSSME